MDKLDDENSKTKKALTNEVKEIKRAISHIVLQAVLAIIMALVNDDPSFDWPCFSILFDDFEEDDACCTCINTFRGFFFIFILLNFFSLISLCSIKTSVNFEGVPRSIIKKKKRRRDLIFVPLLLAYISFLIAWIIRSEVLYQDSCKVYYEETDRQIFWHMRIIAVICIY